MQGKLEDTHVTQVWFKDDNIIKWQSHFGCGLVYYDPKIAKQINESKVNIFKSRSEAWVNHRSFFISSEGHAQFDFSDIKYQRKSLVQGKIIDLDFKFNEVKVYKGTEEIMSEEDEIQARFEVLKTIILTTGLKSMLGSFSSFAQVPLSFFPEIERCLGLKENGAFMEISEGIARIGYDYKVK